MGTYNLQLCNLNFFNYIINLFLVKYFLMEFLLVTLYIFIWSLIAQTASNVLCYKLCFYEHSQI